MPSRGLGGGIEAYGDAVLEALSACGAQVSTLALVDGSTGRPSVYAKAGFMRKTLSQAKRLDGDPQVILGFSLSFALLADGARRRAGPRANSFVFLHGSEVWGARPSRRAMLKHTNSQLVAASNFTAGAVSSVTNAQVLNPGIPSRRYYRLLDLPIKRSEEGPLEVLSVFRLPEAESKGAYVVIDACRRLRDIGRDIRLTFAGNGPLPSTLMSASAEPWIKVVDSPSDAQLYELYGDADLFILATRTRFDRRAPSGEGFGIVLTEAALASLPVIAPAFGGSSDAFIDGVTGLRPLDESWRGLSEVLDWSVAHRSALQELGRNGRLRAQARFDPAAYGATVRGILLGITEVQTTFSSLDLLG